MKTRLYVCLLLVLPACGGDSNNGNDASTDGTTSDAASDVVGNDVVKTNDAGCPEYTGSVEICKAAVAKCNACANAPKITACQVQNLDAVCAAAANIFSTAYANAESACASVCDVDASSSCTKAALADASLTAAQSKLVVDYCGPCGQQGCGLQLGPSVVQYSDTLVTEIDQKCSPDGGGPDSGACIAYGTCASGILQNALAGLPCADASTD